MVIQNKCCEGAISNAVRPSVLRTLFNLNNGLGINNGSALLPGGLMGMEYPPADRVGEPPPVMF